MAETTNAPKNDLKTRNKTNFANAWAEAQELVWTHRRRLAIGLALMLVNRLSGIVLPATSKYLVDDVIGKHRADLLLPLALAAGGATLVDAITAFSLSQILGVAAQRAIADMRMSMQRHVTRLPIRYFDSTQTGVLISRVMNDADGIRNLVGSGVVQLTGGLVTGIIALAVLFHLNWRLTLVCMIVLAMFAVGMIFAFRRLRPLFRERGKLTAAISGRLAESFGGIRIVKAYIAEEREDRVFEQGTEVLFANVRRTLTGVATVTAFGSVVIGAIGTTMMVVGGRAILAGTMTLGDFIMYIFFVGLLAAPLVQMSAIGTQLSEALAGLDRIREIKAMSTEDHEDAALEPIGPLEGEIVFDAVSFEYETGVPVLKGVSFSAPAGTTTALVGSSGSGKSTLMGLVMAFSRPTSGRILVDGHDLASVRLRDYRQQLGVVLQDNFMFDGSVAENIRFSRPHATIEEVKAVSRIAHSDEFIGNFPKGYETVVGERGVKLSGGQRQRVAIARAILADPRILILDEATSSLDSESEALIQDGLHALRKGRTTFVIAHRLSTIRSADQILVLEAGQVVERGSHRDLLAANGRYRQLYDKQYKIEGDRFMNPGEDFTPDLPIPVPELSGGPGSPLCETYMKTKVLALVAVVALGGGAWLLVQHTRQGREGAPAASTAPGGAKAKLSFIKDATKLPPLVMKTLDGGTLNSADWNGKVVLINFWATWCPPCREEIPDLIKLQEQYKDRLLIIGISSDTAPTAEVAKFVADHKMNYPIVMETPELLTVFPGVFALPTTFVVDGDLKMVKKHVGLLNPGQVELETRYLAKLPVNADVEYVADTASGGLANQAQATDVPGLKLELLRPDQKIAALKRLNDEKCECGCGLTIAQCRINDPTCAVSLPLAEKIVAEIKKK